ncbi:MAG: response regulator, partial [Planctomycetota bacterium]
TLVSLEKELLQLSGRLETLSQHDREGAHGQAIENAIAERRMQHEETTERLAALMEENRSLRAQLSALRAQLKESEDGDIFMAEVHAAEEACDQKQEMMEKTLARATRVRHQVAAELGEPGAAVPTAPPPQPEPDPSQVHPSPSAPPSRDEKEAMPLAPAGYSEEQMKDGIKHALHEAQQRWTEEKEHLQMESEAQDQAIEELKKINDRLGREHSFEAKRVKTITRNIRALQRKVLVVDDEAPIRMIISTTLEETGLFQTLNASTAKEAVKTLQDTAIIPDLIFLDIMMPEISGTEFLAALERNPKFKRIPVIFCSARPKNEVKDLRNLRPAAYLQKPVPAWRFVEIACGVLNLPLPEPPEAD